MEGMEKQIQLLRIIGYILTIQLLLLVSECEMSKSSLTDEFIEASNKRKTLDALTCHVCHSETHPNCLNLTESSNGTYGYPHECDKTCTYCLVRKFSFTLTDENQTWPMKTFGIKRNCSAKCDPGCVIMGERTRLYVCNSCCQGDMCNTGSGALPSRNALNVNPLGIFGLALYGFRQLPNLPTFYLKSKE